MARSQGRRTQLPTLCQAQGLMPQTKSQQGHQAP
eukprot:CAMPEP_0114678182 /NCGR_PEP_ID=MMETSP0191-20121206/51388_1 /TAXON_ID=126664 /ORGANISM="Sorites sp." /LENGTH=33 /DNA_ID= /DNA_START= /DNA_END= /DNA_ORIENTATION=